MYYSRFVGVRKRISTLTVAAIFLASSLASAIVPVVLNDRAKAATAPDHVVINEIMADPSDGVEWVELYNPTVGDIDISHWKIKDNGTFGTIPAATTLNSHDYYVVEYSGSKLSNSGETVTLEKQTGPDKTVDTKEYPALSEDKSYGRSPDGDSDWMSFAVTQTTKNASNYVDTSSSDPVENTDTSETFTTIQAAIDDSDTANGHTITVANGTYEEALRIDKSLTFIGESEAGVVLDASVNSGYGLSNTVDGLTMVFKKLTLKDAQHYGFKLTGGSATLEDVTAMNAAKTEVDFNGMTSVTLKNVTANGNNTSGNGVTFTNSDNIMVDGLTTSNNNWGGVAMYPYSTHYPVGIENVELEDVNASELNPLYEQVGDGGTPVENLTADQFVCRVTGEGILDNGNDLSEFTFYQYSGVAANAYKAILEANAGVISVNVDCDDTEDPVTEELDEGMPGDDSFWNGPIEIAGTSTDNQGVDYVNLYYRASGSGDDWALIGSVDNPDDDSPFDWYYEWTPGEDGVYDIKAAAVDTSGNEENSAYAYNVTFDTTPPDVPDPINPDSDANPFYTGDAFTQQWTDEGTTGAVKYEYLSCYQAVQPTGDTCPGGVTTWTNTYTDTSKHVGASQPDSHFFWHVRAVDAAGNESAWSDWREIVIDSTAPDVPTSPQVYFGHTMSGAPMVCGETDGPIYTNTDDILVDWTHPNPSDVAYYWFGIDNANNYKEKHKNSRDNPGEFTDGSTAYKVDINSAGNNPHRYLITAVDAAGNKSVMLETCPIVLDQEAPEVALTTPGEEATC